MHNETIQGQWPTAKAIPKIFKTFLALSHASPAEPTVHMEFLKAAFFALSDACSLANMRDALYNRQALSERSELGLPTTTSAPIQSNKAKLGVNGFGHFGRNQSGSAAGTNPGITENRLDIRNSW